MVSRATSYSTNGYQDWTGNLFCFFTMIKHDEESKSQGSLTRNVDLTVKGCSFEGSLFL